MEEQIFDKGDVVVLKSGSPEMTVKGYRSLAGIGSIPNESSTDVVCVWFEGGEKTQNIYHQDLLRLA